MNSRILSAAAYFCVFLSLFPFAVITEGIAFSEYVWWHYFALYGVNITFFLMGYLCRGWVSGGSFSKKLESVAVFFSRAAVAVPIVIFSAVVLLCGLSAGLFLYSLPAAVIAYFYGYSAFGKGYSDVFTRGQFALFFVAGIIAAILLSLTYDKEISSVGMYQLCISFGVLIVMAAVLTNQTNIDMRTSQRSAGKAVLPDGLRSYNALLIAAVGAVIVGLCLFSGPVAKLVFEGIKQLISLLLSLLRNNEYEVPDYQYDGEYQSGEYISYEENTGSELLNLLLLIILIVVIIRFRKQIWSFIKEIAAPLFKQSEQAEAVPFYDEVADSAAKFRSGNRKKELKQLYKRYCREDNSVARYRIGYTLFLMKLSDSPYSQAISDTTLIHNIKGNNAFHRDELDGMVAVYNKVRYGGYTPTTDELSAQHRLIEQIM